MGHEELKDCVENLKNGRHKKKWTFTLEPGRGETYRNNKPTLYGHSIYERSSVLAGRPQRVFVACWDNWETARQTCKAAGVRYSELGGTTHIPTSRLVAHLPDDTDY